MESHRRGAIHEVGRRPAAFSLAFFGFFTATFIFLAVVGATPNPIASNQPPQTTNIAATTSQPEAPVRLVAKDIGLDVAVVNPTSTDVTQLDDALTQGAVHYPTSAPLGVNGTALIFGHSSYLPVVYHQYYKTFDGIQNLKEGDIVSVYSATTEYRYSVVGVRVANAADQSDNQIPLPNDAKYLTLITCDSFAATTNRFIVTANFVGAYGLAQ